MQTKVFWLSAISALALVACHGEKPPETTTSGGDNVTSSSSTTSTGNDTAGSGSTSGGSTTGGDVPTPPGESCGGKACAVGESCVSYYGIAGPRGPQFHDCVIPCRRGAKPNDGCPEGKKCHTIADGPGDVCN
jgi:hypothetical protein